MKWLRSRQFWMQIITIVLTVIYALEPFVEPVYFAAIVAVVQAVAFWFRIDARVK